MSLLTYPLLPTSFSIFFFTKSKAEIFSSLHFHFLSDKDNPRKPQSAADKAKARAHQAKVDKENAAARAKDPSQGRYPKG